MAAVFERKKALTVTGAVLVLWFSLILVIDLLELFGPSTTSLYTYLAIVIPVAIFAAGYVGVAGFRRFVLSLDRAVVMGFARASGNRGAPPVSTGLTTAEEMRGRLEGFLDEANDAAAQHRPEQAGPKAEERSAKLAEILADHTARHVAILQGVLDRGNLSDKARDAIMSGRSNAEVGLQRAMEVAAQARDAVRDMGGIGKPEDSRGRGPNQPGDGS